MSRKQYETFLEKSKKQLDGIQRRAKLHCVSILQKIGNVDFSDEKYEGGYPTFNEAIGHDGEFDTADITEVKLFGMNILITFEFRYLDGTGPDEDAPACEHPVDYVVLLNSIVDYADKMGLRL